MLRRWDSADCAKRNTRPMRCQTSDKIVLPLEAVRHRCASLSQHPQPGRHRPSRARVRAGLNVLTGETGAGKSILVGAVGLLVGGRASRRPRPHRRGHRRPSQAIFETPDGGELIVRREVSAQGRSRAFVDGALATSAALRDASAALVDLHGQHEHQVLLDPRRTSICSTSSPALTPSAQRWRRRSRDWQQLRDERERLAAGEQQKASRAEFLAFQLAEIDRVAPKPGEDEELDGDAAGARQRRPAAAAVRRGLHGALRRRRGGARRRSATSGRRSASSPRSTRGSRRTSTRATRSSRSSRTSRSSCGRTRQTSTRRRRACRRSRIASRCSSV